MVEDEVVREGSEDEIEGVDADNGEEGDGRDLAR